MDWKTSKYNNNTKQLNLDVSSLPETFIIPETCCKANISNAECKKATRIQSGSSKIDSPSIHLKVNCNFVPFRFTLKKPQISNDEFLFPMQGCSEKLVQEAQNHLLIILAIIAGILVFEIFALMISLCLCCAVGDREDDYKS